MKIAIISLPLSYNYGGYLQCYALMETLRQLGHKVYYLQRENGKQSTLKKTFNTFKRICEYIGLGNLIYTLEKQTNSGLFYKTRYFRKFTRKYIKTISPVLRSTKDIEAYCKKHSIQAYITGSDQIWRGSYSRSINDAFLGFAPKGSIKIAYAPSFGSSVWEFNLEQTQFIEKQLNTFKAISVREKDGIKLLNENVKLKITPIVVLDPTFLLSKEHYLNIAKQTTQRNGVLTYILNNNERKTHAISEFCKKKNLKSYSVINPKTNTNIIKGAQGYPIEDWLGGFRDASFIMTDSFHAIVFSIIFNKPFWVFENEARGNSRLTNILQLFDCNDRFISSQEDLNTFDWERPINWNKINQIKDILTKKSLDFLKTSLQND